MPSPLDEIIARLERIEADVERLLSTICDCPQCRDPNCEHPFVAACQGVGGGHGHHEH